MGPSASSYLAPARAALGDKSARVWSRFSVGSVANGWTNLLGTGWADVKLSADTPDFVQGSFASDQVRQLGFELRVFSNTQRPTAAVVFIDNVGY